MARGQDSVRLGRLGQREGRRHAHLQEALFGLLRQVETCPGPDFVTGVRTRSRTKGQDAELESALHGRQGGDAPAIGHQLEGGVDRLVGSDTVDGRVHPAGRQVSYPLRQPLAVEHRFGAETAELGVTFLAGGADHPHPLRHGQLDDQKAHATGRAVQDQGFPRCDPDGDECVDRSRADQHQAGGLFEGEGGRLGYDRLAGDDHLRRVGPHGVEGDDLVANVHGSGRPFGTVAHRQDDSGRLEPEGHRQRGGIMAPGSAVELVVDRIGPGRPDFEQDLPGTGHTDLFVNDGEDFWPSECGGNDLVDHVVCNRCRPDDIPARKVRLVTDVGTKLELDVGEIAGGGGCVARAPDGRVVFVRHSLPGERVVATITSTTSSFIRADATEVVRSSPDRVTPPCPYAGPGRCGGCDFQHIDPVTQRHLKASRIADQLQRVAGVTRAVRVDAVAGDENGLGWRTRVRLAVDDTGHLGFRQHRSHALELVDHCPIACRAVMETGAFESGWPGVDELEVIVAPDSGESLIAVDVSRKAAPTLPPVAARLVVNGRPRQRSGAVHTKVAGVDFRVSAGVFWQVHVGAAEALARAVRTALGATPGDKVVDLYAGAGLFSVLLADDVGTRGSVLAVERERRACADAEYNGQGRPQLRVRRASITPNLVEHGIGAPDLLVLDPAREGAGKAVMAALHGHTGTLRRLVYVSCDPSSFSRDLRVLLNAHWSLVSLRAFDIFPMTEHVELVAALEPPGR
jgi:tRNA/tmRNA/rRNA uracil-C5-methylase (TrmA/RlmC/RlmD family)